MGVENPKVKPPRKSAAGVPAVMHALEYSLEQTSLVRTAINLLTINQTNGIDCPGCAWPEPEPGKRHKNEYCENGAKHINDEATTRRITREFFREHSVSELAAKSDMWLNEQGRLTEPMVKRPGSDYYEPISWDDALDLLAAELRALDSPDEALFYTSGRLSNEAAFLLQLFARAFGTNNLPDCSNMCHESSGAGLNETLGVGKGSVSLDDLHEADLVFAVGLNPGTNMPRMLSALEETKRNGGHVIAVNPLPEAGLIRFKNPQKASGHRRPRDPDRRSVPAHQARRRPGTVPGDQRTSAEGRGRRSGNRARPRVHRHPHHGLRGVRQPPATDRRGRMSLTRPDFRARRSSRSSTACCRSRKIIVCWAMGVTQQKHGVATVREIVNFLMLRGNLGRPGTGVCPVRGHSNVQGDRTMGIWEKMPQSFLDALGAGVRLHSPVAARPRRR